MRPEEHQAYSFEDERKRIKACFCAFVEGSLVSHDIDAVLQLFCDEMISFSSIEITTRACTIVL